MKILLEDVRLEAKKKAKQFVLSNNDESEFISLLERICEIAKNDNLTFDDLYFEYHELFNQVSICLNFKNKKLMLIMEEGSLIKAHFVDENNKKSFQDLTSPSDDIIKKILINFVS